jgi:hypothetical protein
MAAIEIGPVAVSIAVPEIFKNYASGIFDSKECGTNLSHAVTAIGYGTD